MKKIPRVFYRAWLGPAPIPDLFEEWWEDLRRMHPRWKLVTITDKNQRDFIPNAEIQKIVDASDSYATRSNIG